MGEEQEQMILQLFLKMIQEQNLLVVELLVVDSALDNEDQAEE